MNHQTIRTDRFLRAYGIPSWLEKCTLAKVKASPPRAFLSEGHPHRDKLSYDLGRIHTLLLDLEKGDLDPITVDCQWSGYTPSHFVLIDGHHRLVAHVLAQREVIPASCDGPVDGIRWLQGRRKNPPQWMIDGGLIP